MTFDPVRVDADLAERLSDTSRINYGKVYTVECNIKVKNIGMVHVRSLPKLIYQFRKVWESRIPTFPGPEKSMSLMDEETRDRHRTALIDLALGPVPEGISDEEKASAARMIDRLLQHNLLRLEAVSSMSRPGHDASR